ncbi:MAG: hypothetical protein AAB966_03450 [Patescibacteria group bacterium]
MKKKTTFLSVFFLVLILILIGAYNLPYFRRYIDTCIFASDKYTCYTNNTHSVLSRKGVNELFLYIDQVVVPNNNYALVHLVLHDTGELIYNKERNIQRTMNYAIALIKKHTKRGDIYFEGFDGYLHGAIIAYFQDINVKQQSIDKKIEDLCGLNKNQETINKDEFECYHIVGHGLTNYFQSDVAKASDLCDTFEGEAAKGGCYMGVFMENAFLYSKTYHPDLLRKFVMGKSMALVCERFTKAKHKSCSHLVPTSYFINNPLDTKGAINECKKLTNDYGACIVGIAVIHIPSIYEGNFAKMKGACNATGEDTKALCYGYVARALYLGLGGENYTKTDFCKLIPEGDRILCSSYKYNDRHEVNE